MVVDVATTRYKKVKAAIIKKYWNRHN